jgi:hypothetical protein
LNDLLTQWLSGNRIGIVRESFERALPKGCSTRQKQDVADVNGLQAGHAA